LAKERLGLPQPGAPGVRRLLSRLAHGQHPRHERPAAQDALVHSPEDDVVQRAG